MVMVGKVAVTRRSAAERTFAGTGRDSNIGRVFDVCGGHG